MRRWDIFCTVVDNFGDIGICWRLSQQLACEHGVDVRLWVDKPDRLASLYPSIQANETRQRAGPIEIRHWPSDFPPVDPADVVIEAFACELPERYVAAMASRPVAPVWINLEYLSAESWVDGCHLLASPHPRLPLTKHFFFPGFTPRTGGLLRERDLGSARAAFDAAAAGEFLRSLGVAPRTGDELLVSLFCYENPALPELLQCWAAGPGSPLKKDVEHVSNVFIPEERGHAESVSHVFQQAAKPVRVLTTPGAATEQVGCWLGRTLRPGTPLRSGSLTVQAIPFLSQPDFDRLLWASDINFVRGEDSFIRAQWAEKPFVWQIYPQAGNAHLVKLDAFLKRYLGDFEQAESDAVRQCWQAWNGAGGMADAWRQFVENRQSIQRHGKVWAGQLDRLGDLANNLVRFAHGN